VLISPDDRRYFDRLRDEHGIDLDAEQQAWYVTKAKTQGDKMKREYPCHPDEAFEAALEGAYYATQMAQIRRAGQICRVPWEPAKLVNTFWDLGRNDEMVIWFHQRVGKENRFIDYYANSGEGLAHYAKVLREKPYVYGTHYLPHDVEVAEMIADQTRRQALEDLGIRPIETVRKTESVGDDIELCRQKLRGCWFDETNCAAGIKCLDAYRKKWDRRNAVFLNKPHHDWASHGADAFRTFAVGYQVVSLVPVEIDYGARRRHVH